MVAKRKFNVKTLLMFAEGFGLRVKLTHNQDTIYQPCRPHHLRAKISGYIFLHGNFRNLADDPVDETGYIGRELAHELGHYLVATPSRRRRKDYGIPLERKRPERSELYWKTDEFKAVLVEHCIRAHFGDWRAKKDPLRRMLIPESIRKKVSVWWKTEGQAMVDTVLKTKRI